MNDFKHIKMVLNTKTTTLGVINNKLMILKFIRLNRRQPSTHSPSKKEVKLAWAMKNYTNKLNPSYDSFFDKEVKKAKTHSQNKLETDALKYLELAEQFVKDNGFRIETTRSFERSSNDPGYCFAKLAYRTYMSKLLKKHDFEGRLEKIMAHPTQSEFQRDNKRLETMRFIQDNGRFPKLSNGDYEKQMYGYIVNAFDCPTKQNLKFRQAVKQIAIKLNLQINRPSFNTVKVSGT